MTALLEYIDLFIKLVFSISQKPVRPLPFRPYPFLRPCSNTLKKQNTLIEQSLPRSLPGKGNSSDGILEIRIIEALYCMLKVSFILKVYDSVQKHCQLNFLARDLT